MEAIKKRISRPNNKLPICIVTTIDSVQVGFLYFKNSHVVVLLNHINEKADLGPIKNFRDEHFEPEATIMVIPAAKVISIKKLNKIL